ncbi:hypothetical protein N7488_011883 [Penicillium malachiteum]|nr:hypothetical protein N7488_011883 [Penicillium malachiteum]
MTRGLGLREYRACVRCRSRKTRCDLQSSGAPGKPPCVKCTREGVDCVLADSRRGGNHSHLRRSKKRATPGAGAITPQSTSTHLDKSPILQPLGNGDHHVHDHLQNPSDALLILAHAAGQPDRNQPGFDTNTQSPPAYFSRGGVSFSKEPNKGADYSNISDYCDDLNNLPPLLQDKTINLNLLFKLCTMYKEHYHSFFPLVPASVLNPGEITKTLKNESFLLTTILLIASKDLPELTHINKAIWSYLRQRILDIALGAAGTHHISCVEGLLLLGEWTLPTQTQAGEIGSEAPWSILGLAVRLAYRLRLEESSFPGSDNDNDQDTDAERKRLAWTFTYLSDRQISIRMGQAFWCRGPALSARFTAKDFPSLQPQTKDKDTTTSEKYRKENEDLASWLQAQVEITTLFGNAHDILFASKSRTVELITRGDYVKYIDDTSRAISAWDYAWQSISSSKPLRSCLELMRDYLRLYVNAFAFQAVLYRGSSRKEPGIHVLRERQPENNSQGRAGFDFDTNSSLEFPYSTMASADAKHIYEALDAAESLLRIFIEDFDPVKHLRFLPDRFYLYEIHSSVFLFKSHLSGAISPARYQETKKLMHRFISVLTQVSVDENHAHIASRYAKLLQRLWFHREEQASNNAGTGVEKGICDQNGQRSAEMNASTSAGVDSDISTDLAGGPRSFMDADVYGIGTQGLAFDYAGLEGLDGVEGLDGLLAMPPVFPYDLSLFLNDISF